MAAVSWLYKNNPNDNVSLICLGVHPDYEGLKGLGELSSSEFQTLFPARMQLTPAEMKCFDGLWKIYCSSDHRKLKEHSDCLDSQRFPHMTPALSCHERRFPHQQSGLSEVEEKILNMLSEAPKSERALVGELLRWQEWQGFGDVQYENHLKAMKGLIENKDGLLHLTAQGKQALAMGLASPLDTMIHPYGGASTSSHVYDRVKGSLIMREA